MVFEFNVAGFILLTVIGLDIPVALLSGIENTVLLVEATTWFVVPPAEADEVN